MEVDPEVDRRGKRLRIPAIEKIILKIDYESCELLVPRPCTIGHSA